MPDQIKRTETLLIAKKLLREIREKHGITQQDVRRQTGIHIARFENNENDLKLSTLRVLLDHYQLTMSDFFRLLEKRERSFRRKKKKGDPFPLQKN